MSGKKSRHLQKLAEQERARMAARRRRRWLLVLAVLAVLTLLVVMFWRPAKPAPALAVKMTDGEMWTLGTLLDLKPHQLRDMDVALMNLLCAEGHQGAAKLDIQATLARINDMATRVRIETDRHFYKFRSNPGEFENSEPYYRMMMLVTVLQQDFGIRYNPARVSPVGVIEPGEKFFADPRDVFIHGLTGPPGMGTCSSLPVLYVAVGRLRYPLSLVPAKGHLFLRWEDQHGRLNVDAAATGTVTHDDAHYRNWPYPFTEAEQRANGYLKNLTPAEELAVFLTIRGACLLSKGRIDDSISAYTHAARLAPQLGMEAVLSAVKRDAAGPRVWRRSFPDLACRRIPPFGAIHPKLHG